MKTYNYSEQRWVEDSGLLRQQIALLLSSRGKAYAAFINADYDTMLAQCNNQLRELP